MHFQYFWGTLPCKIAEQPCNGEKLLEDTVYSVLYTLVVVLLIYVYGLFAHYQLTIYLNREVQKNTEASRALYNRWCELADQPGHGSKEEYDWTTSELRNRLRSIEWDLEDLEETIGMTFLGVNMNLP